MCSAGAAAFGGGGECRPGEAQLDRGDWRHRGALPQGLDKFRRVKSETGEIEAENLSTLTTTACDVRPARLLAGRRLENVRLEAAGTLDACLGLVWP